MLLLRCILIRLREARPDRKRTPYTLEQLFLVPVLYVVHLLLAKQFTFKNILDRIADNSDRIRETTLQRMLERMYCVMLYQ